MTEQPKVSVVIPIYNKGASLRRALESVVHQTLKDIEIICVDDGSTDGSRAIIDEYAERDTRIVKIYHETNLGTSLARKNGVAASRGEYVMFLDGDDAFMLNACEVAYNAVQNANVDIVHFDTHVIDLAFMQQSTQGVQNFCAPYIGVLNGNLIDACWKDRKFSWHMCTKIFRGGLIRRAFAEIEDIRLIYAEDIYSFFIIAYYARSYLGIKDVLYDYFIGVGATRTGILTIDEFVRSRDEVAVVRAIMRFCQRYELCDRYANVLDWLNKNALGVCVSRWRDLVAENDRTAAFNVLVDMFSIDDVLCHLAKFNWDSCELLGGRMLGLPQFEYLPRPAGKKLTIGVYGWRATMGGTEHVSVMLCNLFAEEKDEFGDDKYNVVLITDGEKQPGEYSLSLKVKRAYLPAYETSVRERYRDRLRAWRSIIAEYDIDIVEYGLYWDVCAFWDMLAVKSAPSHPALVEHHHSYCSDLFRDGGHRAVWYTYACQICDGVIGLSECDREFFSAYNVNARFIINPFEFDPKNTQNSDLTKNTIVWVGRFAEEKNPLDVLKMVKIVRSEIPDVQLYIVGGRYEETFALMQKYIEAHDLSGNVHLTGVTLDTETYYQKASVYVSTSSFEVFSLTMAEALTHGVPVVTYDMPYLTMIRDGRGIITVPQGQYTMLADEVIKLLRDPARVRELGAQGKQMVTELANVDIMAQWNELFAAINSGKKASHRTDSAAINSRYITQFAAEGKKRAREQGKRDVRNSPDVRRFLTGRIDIKDHGEGHDVLITGVTSGTIVEKPAWFAQGGQGAVLHNTLGTLQFVVQCVGNGILSFALRGQYYYDEEKHTLPYFVDFMSFTVNGEEKLGGRTPVWHDAPFKFEMPVKDGEIVTVTAKWQPHVPERSVLIDGPKKAKELREQLDGVRKDADLMRQKLRRAEENEAALNSQLEKSRKSAAVLAQKIELADERGLELQKRLDLSQKERSAVERKLEQKRQVQLELTARLNDAETQLRNIRRGFSFKVGRLVTWLPRKLTGKKW